ASRTGGCSLVVRNVWPPATRPAPSTVVRSGNPERRSGLLDLPELQINRHGAPEDRNLHLEPRTLLVHLLHIAVEGSERTIGDAHLLTDVEGDGRLWPLHTLLNLGEDALGLRLGDRHRPRVA